MKLFDVRVTREKKLQNSRSGLAQPERNLQVSFFSVTALVSGFLQSLYIRDQIV